MKPPSDVHPLFFAPHLSCAEDVRMTPVLPESVVSTIVVVFAYVAIGVLARWRHCPVLERAAELLGWVLEREQ
jgi:hypothetical protein